MLNLMTSRMRVTLTLSLASLLLLIIYLGNSGAQSKNESQDLVDENDRVIDKRGLWVLRLPQETFQL
jgi:hypothetical protein